MISETWAKFGRAVLFAVILSACTVLLLLFFSKFVGVVSDGTLLVSVLGILVAALIGLQIINIFAVNNSLKGFDNEIQNLKDIMRRRFNIAGARVDGQIRNLNSQITSLNDDITLNNEHISQIRTELNVHPQIHEAYVFAMVGEDDRRNGNTYMGFDNHMRAAFILLRDIEHYDLRFMGAISSMQTCVEDLFRTIPNRDREIQQFNIRKAEILRDLRNLLQQANSLKRFSEQAQRELGQLIHDVEEIPQTPQTPPIPSN